MTEEQKEAMGGTAPSESEIPEGAIPLFKDSYGNTAFIKNVPNPHLPASTNQSTTTPIYKSVREHKHMTTMTEARAFTKMSHASEGFKGSERPDLGSIEKAMSDVQCGNTLRKTWTKDMSASEAVAQDWADFDRFLRTGH